VHCLPREDAMMVRQVFAASPTLNKNPRIVEAVQQQRAFVPASRCMMMLPLLRSVRVVRSCRLTHAPATQRWGSGA
jgi:hypothetical protein